MGYESEHTRFMREFLAKNPQVAEQQKKNRATWWDKPQDLETTAERAKSRVPQPGYVYFPSPEPIADDSGDPENIASTPSSPT
ncbi:MAG TPA: DUF3460 family protein [Usitatibacter sp.]|jgi:hypothetical protein|nr:DUF3460 family protein [Usitatibacter sp.]